MVTMMKMNDDDDDEDGYDDDEDGDDDDDEGAAAAAAADDDDTDDIDEEEGVKRPSSSLCSMLPSLLIPWVVKSYGRDNDGKHCLLRMSTVSVRDTSSEILCMMMR